MILELDCGNTRIKWRFCVRGDLLSRGTIASHQWQQELPSLVAALDESPIERILVCSVLGDTFRRQFSLWAMENFGVVAEFAVSELSGHGVINGYQEPEKLGVDRWLAVVAARRRTKAPCIVVDCGSAITVDLITSEGEHLGGYIAPGIELMRNALGRGTTQIKLGQIGYAETDFPGRNTVAAIKSAELAMLNGLVVAARACLGAYNVETIALVLTGGDGQWLSEHIGGQYVDELVFEGLELVMGIEITTMEPI